jgi:hypothetical protein
MSAASLVGGGKIPEPGEIALASGGILFLDELPEFSRTVTESLRQPLEDGQVTITRAAGRFTFPCHIMLVCAMNPCPCGYYGSDVRQCTCKKDAIAKYLAKISGPLLDRIDMHVEVPSLTFDEMSRAEKEEPSAAIRERVVRAREFAARRFADGNGVPNGMLTPAQIQEMCIPDEAGKAILRRAMDKMGLSARGYDHMQPTYFQVYQGLAVISFAATQGDTILYPDLIKLQLRLDNAQVVGMEARNYWQNHAARGLLQPTLSLAEAKKSVSEQLQIESSRLCLIPSETGEKLCYEFRGEFNGDTYLLYIDAASGEEANLLKLVEGPTGLEAV